jgi:hypothetical protein
MDHDLDLLFETWTLGCRACATEFELQGCEDPISGTWKARIPSACPNCSMHTRVYHRPGIGEAANIAYRMYGIPTALHVPNLVVDLWASLDEQRDVEAWRELLLQVDIERIADELRSCTDSHTWELARDPTPQWQRWSTEYRNRRAAMMLEEWRSGRYAERVELLLAGVRALILAEQARHAELAASKRSSL